MIATTYYDLATAGIAAIAAITASYLSYKALAQGKTTNGSTLGELVEDMSQRMTRIEEWFVDHLRDHTHGKDELP